MENIGGMEDIQNLFKETIAEVMEASLEAELDEELGYRRYDYKIRIRITVAIEQKILSMHAKGMTSGNIGTHIQDVYRSSVSDSTVSRITEKILPVVKEW